MYRSLENENENENENEAPEQEALIHPPPL
jgi:hypothetical protein